MYTVYKLQLQYFRFGRASSFFFAWFYLIPFIWPPHTMSTYLQIARFINSFSFVSVCLFVSRTPSRARYFLRTRFHRWKHIRIAYARTAKKVQLFWLISLFNYQPARAKKIDDIKTSLSLCRSPPPHSHRVPLFSIVRSLILFDYFCVAKQASARAHQCPSARLR